MVCKAFCFRSLRLDRAASACPAAGNHTGVKGSCSFSPFPRKPLSSPARFWGGVGVAAGLQRVEAVPLAVLAIANWLSTDIYTVRVSPSQQVVGVERAEGVDV